ncbi:hypothetical protein [Pseudogulbenkiania ferrooxidans]|uniref:Uncharacterized protein n=1 Tax=Pseudogulbenkiania ferrooxidans 2002 TaxID=279714 RepID=B9Z6V4_9NEIS|nr:hypothetical protein [Pseudogulbenkiania ferrooxidans]EEG07269.1 hypothetical protein FuraDRAFT_3090 [Pseudogulbenkiania ferrooxidans 2002]
MSRPPGLPKTGGRKPGSPNRNQLTEDMRKSIVAVFKKMGGTRWLLDWAKENETEFVRLVLSRVLPAAPRDDSPNLVINTGPQVNVDELSDLQAASRIAFALQTFAAERLEPQLIEGEHVKPAPAEPTPTPAPAPQAPEPASEAEREVAHFGSGAEQGVKRRNLL